MTSTKNKIITNLRRYLPPGLLPFWAQDNISQATDSLYLETKYVNNFDDLFTGILPSTCLLPCLRTVATVEKGTTTARTGPSVLREALERMITLREFIY